MSSGELGPFLQAAERLLRDNVLTATEGGARFAGLMVASALGMASREVALRERLAAAGMAVAGMAGSGDPTALSAEIRAGRFDGDASLHRLLMAQAALRTAVTRPQALRADEKTLVGPV